MTFTDRIKNTFRSKATKYTLGTAMVVNTGCIAGGGYGGLDPNWNYGNNTGLLNNQNNDRNRGEHHGTSGNHSGGGNHSHGGAHSGGGNHR